MVLPDFFQQAITENMAKENNANKERLQVLLILTQEIKVDGSPFFPG